MTCKTFALRSCSFNTQPPEGGWASSEKYQTDKAVSTHSRPKAAGHHRRHRSCFLVVSTHSRPKAAGYTTFTAILYRRGFNTQPPEGGWFCAAIRSLSFFGFQHTAARRRLAVPTFMLIT